MSVNLQNFLGYIPLVVNMKSHNKCQKADTTDALEVNLSTFDTFCTFDKFDTFKTILRGSKNTLASHKYYGSSELLLYFRRLSGLKF